MNPLLTRRNPPPVSAALLCLVLAAALAVGPALAGNGDPVGGYPTYRERAILALANACRQGPQAYRAAYLGDARILRAATYPAVPPLYWALPLNRSARAHSIDMATTPCFQHDSCDGTNLWDRIRGYYPGVTSMAENIASGYRSPLEVVNGWLLDGGAADHSHGDGHRRNLLSGQFRETGAGSAFGGPGGPYDTQDFGSGAPDFTTPLVSGSHVIDGKRLTFLASYDAHDGHAPREATLRIDDETIPMRLAFGTGANGTYRVTIPAGDECRSYRFRFRDAAGREWRHPEDGTLFTTGEGGCTKEYAPAGREERGDRTTGR
ncbi:MAG: CAP domain-containing protein [Candidatus Eisenbacteria bacterium]